MADQKPQFYQAPLEVNGYVNPQISPIPKQPVDLYGLLGVNSGTLTKPAAKKAKNPYEIMMEGGDAFQGIIPDAAPLQTNLATLEPLDDSAGLFHSQDGFGKYGYSSILNEGDNEDRYSRNFKRDNPHLFWREGFHPWEGIQKGFYWGGGFLEKTLESAVVKTGQGLAGLYGMTVGNVIGVAQGENYNNFADWLTKSTDNIFSNMFDSWDEALKERYHYFQEKSDRDKKGFIQSLSDGDFWMNDISDGLGFLVSAAFEVGLIAKLGLGTKAASRIAPLAEGVPGATAVAEGAQQASKLGRVANFLGVEGGGHTLVKNAVDLTSQTLAITAIESAVEANEVKHKIYDSFEGKVNPETGMYYTEEEKQRLSAAGAAQVFKQNMTILIGPKFLETLVFNRIGKAFKGLTGGATPEAGKASGRIRSRLGNLSSGTSVEKASALKNILKVGSAASIGFLSEGLFEENIQLAISRTAEQNFSAEDEFYRPGTKASDIDKMESDDDLFGEVGRRYMRQTKQFFRGIGDDRFIDDELSKSVGIGGMFGVGGGTIHSVLGLRQQAKIDHYWNNRINAATANLFESQSFYKTETKETVDPKDPTKKITKEVIVTDPKTGQPVLDESKLKTYLNKMGNIQGIMDIINNTEDPNDENNKTHQNKELNKLARNVLFTQLAMEYIRAGKKDVLLSNLASSSNFSDKDIQALGYQPGLMTAQQKKEMLSKMTKIVERLSKSDEWIENNVIDNVSEPRQGFGGIRYTKTQKEKRKQEFEAKKAYLRGLAMQNALLDTYLDEITESEAQLDQTHPEILSSVLDENGVPVVDFSVPLSAVTRDFNSRIPALKNQIAVLQKEFAYHWDNVLSKERNSPKAGAFNNASKTNSGKNLVHSQVKADEALEKMNELQAELDRLTAERNAFLNNDKAFELKEEDGEFYVLPKRQERSQAQLTLEQLQADKIRRVNAVKREEIGIQKGWIDNEWSQVAALKEEKTKAGRAETYFSRRMSISKNAYNTFFQREVMDRDNSLGQRKLKLYDKDEAKRITAKKYKTNEEKLLKAVRIQGKVQSIIADVNGKKILAEIQALLEKDLPSGEFATELKKIVDNYNGQPIVLSKEEKTLVDERIEATREEYNFVASIFEYMPEDERFNDKYYDIDNNGNFVVKTQYDSLPDLARVQKELQDRIDDLTKIKEYLNSIPETVPGDWNNVNVVKKRIADVYTETADSIIGTYNQLSNNGQSEMSGDSLSTKQDLDLIDTEIDELSQLKVIFTDRNKNDMILATSEFQGFIESIDKRIEDLKKIREIVKERMSSRLRENQDFLIDTVTNITEQLGLNFDGTIMTPPIHDEIVKIVGQETVTKLIQALTDLKTLMEKEDQDKDDKKKIADTYWTISGEIAAIQELIKSNENKKAIHDKISEQKKAAIARLEETSLMKKMKGEVFYKDIVDNIGQSLLGALQIVFYNTGNSAPFSQVGLGGADVNFLDDQPSSPVYKFREDYNLRKFIRSVERDNSRTSDNTEVSKEDLLEFLRIAKEIQNLEDLDNSLKSTLNLLDQVETEKKVIDEKQKNQDDKYANLIVSSIQQLFFIRSIASFLKRETGVSGFNNWTYIQAPGGSGKTQTLGTWFNIVSGISRDKILATAFTEEAARGIKKALLVGEEGPKNAEETVDFIKKLTQDKKFDHDVLIIDEFPAIDVQTQKALLEAIQEYSKEKKAQGKGEFKVITMGDTNQLTFSENGSVTPRPTIILNPKFFNHGSHPAQMHIIPSLTVNFRSNVFAVTSFIDQFKGSNKETVNASIKVTSSDPNLEGKDIKGVVSVDKSSFKNKLVAYIKKNSESIRTRTLIVNESKIDEYKKLLQDNGIKIITDPNDELTKGGVYVTSVKNVQGFSFDEVFIDLENNDKTLFGGTSSLTYIYNKAMYVATSRARNLIVTTNFPNIENVEDSSIEALENKALEELQTKDAEFLANRDLEINGAKEILGNQYDTRVKAAPVVQAKPVPVETPLDQEVTTEEEELTPEEEEQVERESEQPEVTEEPTQPEEVVEEEEESQPVGGEVPPADGQEGVEQEAEVAETEKTLPEVVREIMDKVRDTTVTAYDKIKAGVMELLFPTGQTLKYKIEDGDFTVNPQRLTEGFENKALQDGDRVFLVPFRKQRTNKNKRKFGYAVVTPAIDQDGNIIPDSYRTVSVLSDREIDGMKTQPETLRIFESIEQNEQRAEEFVSLMYDDVYSENGFMAGQNQPRNVDILETGKVVHANPIMYFYGRTYREMNEGTLNSMIDTFIENFYRNHIANFPSEQRGAELQRLREFYRNPDNAKIIIPTNKDVIDTPNRKARLRVPPELKGYVRPGRPYLMFKPIHGASDWQFIGLSRKFLNTRDHQDIVAPISEFVRLGRSVKDMLERKGVTNKFGYSRSLSSFLSRAAQEFARDRDRATYTVTLTTTEGNNRVSRDVEFSNAEMQRVYNLYSMYSEPSTQWISATTPQDIQNLTRVNRPRNYVFEDGSVIFGNIVSYNEADRTFVVRDVRNRNEDGSYVEVVKQGVIQHSGRSYVGEVQQILDNIVNSNGHISKNFSSERGRVGFVTAKGGQITGNLAEARGYKFMSLLGSKTAPVVKSYNSDGTVGEFYEDIFDILEDLFIFEGQGDIPAKRRQYVNSNNEIQSMDIQFRVPVPLTHVGDNPDMNHDYTYESSNTSRENTIANSKYFETNFGNLLPSRAMITFEEETVTTPEVEEQPTEAAPEVTTEEQVAPEVPPAPLPELTREDIQRLSFREIRERLTPEQTQSLERWATSDEAGYPDLDTFFTDAESAMPEEQGLFKDYIINCVL